ncbi:MAG: hypothetical protein IJ418_23910 [Clostridia bacterium]|nr:hypothetical protein [Clostridia bacterium]
MKSKYFIAVLLTVLFLVPIFGAQAEDSSFTIDQDRILNGMNRSWMQGYEPSVSQNKWTLVLPVLSETAYGYIQTELIMADETLSPFKPQTMSVKTQRSESGIYAVRLPLELYADRNNGDYACTIRITGKTKSGDALSMEIPYTVRIRDGQPSREVMRMQITDVVTDLKVGEDGTVTATLTNPCKTVSFEQPVLRISDSSREIIPQGADVLYLDDLNPGESRTVTFPMTVKPGAAVSHHILDFNLNWYSFGQNITQTESYTVPVTQEMRLENGGLKMADSVIAGDSLTITLPLMNMGRADLINVLATVSLPGVTDKQSVLVGTITPGETRNAQITITPGKHVVGDFIGTLTVEATDHDGNPTSFSLPLALSVDAPVIATVADNNIAKEKEEPPYLTYGLAGGCSVLLLICIVQGIVLRRKIRKLEEDRL